MSGGTKQVRRQLQNADTAARAKALEHQLGIDLYAKYPLQQVEATMDRPPADPADRKGWRPIYEAEERVYACYIRLSWMFPICMPFAVILDHNGEMIQNGTGPVPVTQERVAEMLGMAQPNVSREVAKLVKKKRLRIDGRFVYPIPDPRQTPEERRIYISTDINQPTSHLVLPRSITNKLEAIRQRYGADSDISTRVAERCVHVAAQFNADLSEIRNKAKTGYEQAFLEAGILISEIPDQRVSEYEEAPTAPDDVQPDESPAAAEDTHSLTADASDHADENADIVVQAIEAECGPFAPRDAVAAQFRTLPDEFGVPPAAVVRCVADKVAEKRKARYPILSAGALLDFVRRDLHRWIRQNEHLVSADRQIADAAPVLTYEARAARDRWEREQRAALANPDVPEQEKHLIRVCLGLNE